MSRLAIQPSFRSRLIASALALACIAALGCASQTEPGDTFGIYKFKRAQMGTEVEITLVALNPAAATAAAEAAFSEIDRLESLLSEYKPDSDVGRINANAGKEPVRVSPETIHLIELSSEISERSSGAFDITFKGLGLWKFDNETAVPPVPEAIRERLHLVGYRKIEIDPTASTVRLQQTGMAIGLGGIAKGYAAQRAADVLRSSGIDSGIVSVGGNLYAFGDKMGSPWMIGVQHPRERSKLVATIKVRDMAVMTSGDYERYFIYNGRRYHHIIDPHTGYPAAGISSVTIMAKDPALADAMSTAVFVLGTSDGMKLVEATEGVEAFIIDDQGRFYFSSGAQGLGLELAQ